MKKLIQTRLHNPPEQVGNCFPTVIACIMGLDDPEEVIQIQERFDEDDWNVTLYNWLLERGYLWYTIDGHLYDDSFYLVVGKSSRGVNHVCIYKNGELYHGPHPSQEGLLTEEFFEKINEK